MNLDNVETFTLYFSTTSSEFDSDLASAVARILRRVADKIDSGEYYPGHTKSILDANGNRIGGYKMNVSSFEPF